MKILMVTSSYPKFPGDTTAPFVESIALGVHARGHAVDVILPFHPDLQRPADEPLRFFPYRYAPQDRWSLWGYAQSLEADVRVRREVYLLAPLVAAALRRELGRRLLAERYDVAHLHWVVPNAALVADMLRVSGLPYIVSLHGSDVFLAERLAPARVLARRAFAGAGAVTACSGDLHKRALCLGAPPGRTRTVPYGVDIERFVPHADPGAVRSLLGVPEGVVFVLALGRLVEKKGFRFLIEAAAGCHGLHVVIAGDGDLMAALREQARKHAAPVSFVGNLDRESMARALGAADIVAVPSVVDRAGNVDGLPNTLLEALAAGRAVVASRVAGIPEVVEEGVNGRLVPEKNVAALRAVLLELTRRPEERQRLGRTARRTAETRLTWAAAVRSFEECYVLACHPDRPHG